MTFYKVVNKKIDELGWLDEKGHWKSKDVFACVSMRKPYWPEETQFTVSFDTAGILEWGLFRYLNTLREQSEEHKRLGFATAKYIAEPILISQFTYDPEAIGAKELTEMLQGDDWEIIG